MQMRTQKSHARNALILPKYASGVRQFPSTIDISKTPNLKILLIWKSHCAAFTSENGRVAMGQKPFLKIQFKIAHLPPKNAMKKKLSWPAIHCRYFEKKK